MRGDGGGVEMKERMRRRREVGVPSRVWRRINF